jgi:hypothetical protein
MLLALALHASTAHADIPAGFGGTPGVVNENTPHYDLEPLYHDGTGAQARQRLLLRCQPRSARRQRHGGPHAEYCARESVRLLAHRDDASARSP